MNIDQPFLVEVKDILQLMDKSIQQGMSVPKLLEELGLASDVLAKDDGLINFEDCWRIMIANQNAIKEESHLMSSRPLKKGTTRLIFSNLQHSETLFDALGAIAETYNIVHGGDYNFVRKRGKILSFIVDDSDFHYSDKPNHFAIEFALIRIHCALSILAGKPLHLARVCTKRSSLPGHHHHLLMFDTKIVKSHSVYELAYDASQLDMALDQGTKVDISGLIYEQYLDLLSDHQLDALKDEFVRSVTAIITEQSLTRESPSQELVASKLNMSVATLRRRLNVYSLNYQTVLDRVNGELSINLLEDHITPSEVAERLGYSDVRSFKRAFQRWHGMSPSAYRLSHLSITF